MKAHALRGVFGGGMAVSVVANGPQPPWQDVPEIAADELQTGNRFGADAAVGGTVLPGKGDVIVAKLPDAGIADGGAGDVGAEVLNGALAVAEGLDVNTPVLGPDRGIGLPVTAVQFVAE